MRTPPMSSIHFHSAGAAPAVMPSFHPRAVWEAALRRAHSPWFRIRPRSALLSGSIFVLLSLFVPVAFNACGANYTGREFLVGEGYWPGMSTLVYDGIERGAFGLGLALAVFTIFLLLLTLRRPTALHGKWVRWTFLLAGVLCVFAVLDFVSLNLAEAINELIISPAGVDKPEIVLPIISALAILLMALCLRSEFVRRQGWVLGVFGVEIVVCVVVMVLSVRAQFGQADVMPMDGLMELSVTPLLLYWLVPVGLWIRFGLSRNEARRAQWQELRPKIMVIYVPVWLIAGILLAIPSAWPLWGLAPYLAGMSLIFLGYAGLVHVDESAALVATSPGGDRPATQSP